MSAYVVVTREKTRDATELEQYKQLAPASKNIQQSFGPFTAAARSLYSRPGTITILRNHKPRENRTG